MGNHHTQILIMDDNPATLQNLTEALNEQGFVAVPASNSEEAWRCLLSEPDSFGLVLLDRQMLEADSIALLRRMKAEKLLRNIPVIMQTGLAEIGDFVEGLQAGAHGYLAKPINVSLLLAMIQSTIRFDRERDSLKQDVNYLQAALQLTTKTSYRLRTFEEAKALSYLLGNLCPESDHTRLGLYELFINAIEHGNLEISYTYKTQLLMENRWIEEIDTRLADPRYKDRMVYVDIEQQSEGFSVLITDQGNGFHVDPYLDFTPERIFELHGRGIAMANKIYLNKVEYLENGNQVKVFIRSTG
ncbi:MAG: response regulator receiver protein [Firmicutes bacterium]|nr:response regulator receiver protein [Bacillota bacterium]